MVFYCKVGGRSAEVLAVAKGAGFANAQHVGGGVVAWVNQIEPSQTDLLIRVAGQRCMLRHDTAHRLPDHRLLRPCPAG